MKKSIKEILDIEQFDFYIHPSDLVFFIDKPKNRTLISQKLHEKMSKSYEEMLIGERLLERANEIQKMANNIEMRFSETEKRALEVDEEIKSILSDLQKRVSNADTDQILTRFHNLIREKEDLSKRIKMLTKEEKGIFLRKDSDSYVTRQNAKTIKELLKDNASAINPDSFILYNAMLAKKYLDWIKSAKQGQHKGYNEFCFENGEIITINENKISLQFHDSVESLKEDLIETILIADRELQAKNKNRVSTISGVYSARGQERNSSKERFSSDELHKFVRSGKVFEDGIRPEKLGEFLKKGIIDKWTIINIINKNNMDPNYAIDLFYQGVFDQEDLKKVFKENNVSNIIKKSKVSFSSKLLLYSNGSISIDELESSVIPNIEMEEQIPDEVFNKISFNYVFNIKKIAELLTHEVLDFNQSMQFLDILKDKGYISENDRQYLDEIMNDFKVKQLLNETENGKRNYSDAANMVESSTNLSGKGVTIDPRVRKEYLKSIGDIKDIFIKGQPLMQDDSARKADGSAKRNSLDGYQLIIVPDKRVAILEKFYEVTRNKEGEVVYKKDEKDRLIPAIENATYIFPIGLAKDFCEKRNKQQLIQDSKHVRRVAHTMNWVKNIESKILTLNPRANFEKENTEKWHQKVVSNYQELLENR